MVDRSKVLGGLRSLDGDHALRRLLVRVLGDTDFINLCNAAHHQLALLCKARGLPVPPVSAPSLPKPSKPAPSQHDMDS